MNTKYYITLFRCLTIEYRLKENDTKHPQLHVITNRSPLLPSLLNCSKLAVLQFYKCAVIFNHPFSYLKHIDLQLVLRN